MKMDVYSTSQAARKVGISRVTLERWISTGKVKAPTALRHAPLRVRLWTEQDVERLRKSKEKFYKKGRGRKPKAKR